jgi:hypothetical protein
VTERTTLGITKEFKKEIDEYPGRNDEQRLKHWAADFEDNDLTAVMTEERVRRIVKEELE